jgi:hypothetical protein
MKADFDEPLEDFKDTGKELITHVTSINSLSDCG